MATEFGNEMKEQMEAFRKATAPDAKPRTSNPVSFECDVSGIDMVVSRIINGKCTMKLFIYLSQTGEDGDGTIFVKTMKDGTIREGTPENISTFLREIGRENSLLTGSSAIPYLRSGKEFAEALLRCSEAKNVSFIKKGILNTEMIMQCPPWYVDRGTGKDSWGGTDPHEKLIRHAAEMLSERDGIPYHAVLAKMCDNFWGRAPRGYDFIWPFSMLADVYDEPYAIRCFDEYIDNSRLKGLNWGALSSLFYILTDSDYRSNWSDIVKKYRNGEAVITLDKNRLWEFIQHAEAVGRGNDIKSYLELYKDYLYQALYCDGVVRDKYPEYLQVAHDVYSEKYKLVKKFNDSQMLSAQADIGAAYIDQTHDGYQLRVLGTVQEFLEEAQQNCNCVASYIDRAKSGRCWIASFRPVDATVTQLTIEILPSGEMVQIKGKFNRNPTDAESERLKLFQQTIRNRISKASHRNRLQTS